MWNRGNTSGDWKLAGLLWTVGLVIYYWALNHWHKFNPDHHWLNIQIIVWAVVLGVVTVGIGYFLDWFRNPPTITRRWMVFIPLAGILLCIMAGVYFTEPIEYGGEVTLASQTRYNWRQSRVGNWYYINFGSSGGSETSDDSTSGGSSSFDFDSDDGEGLVFLVLIVLVIILIVASAVVPHAWVVTGAILLAIALLFVIRAAQPLERRSLYL